MLAAEEWEKMVDYIMNAGPILNLVVIEPYGGRITGGAA